LWANGRWLVSEADPAGGGAEEACLRGESLVYAFAKSETVEKCVADNFADVLKALAEQLPNVTRDATLIDYPWDLVRHNPAQIVADIKAFDKSGIEGNMSEHAAVWGDRALVYLAPTAEVHPFVCLDTSGGPIFIDDRAAVHPHTRISGPCYVGRDSLVVGGKIRAGTSIGPVCRVGGEVEESIIHGYSNKQHDGFLGHAYVCEWVNLGADTSNSDLKNDYSHVSVAMPYGHVDTGMTKVGSFIGDHTKTSIGTLFNTGCYVGVFSNVVGAGAIQPKFIPSFIRLIEKRAYRAPLDELIGTAKTVMGRRGVTLTSEHIALFKYAIEVTRDARQKMLAKARREILAKHRTR
ncbi:MAG: putative sugar nucleotidyl transferase, partial [Planctomycetia bacterium]|nr:putative sugar nucleotidyl transferase [Planctomycetia bacterium]